jgi:hypothetical protein
MRLPTIGVVVAAAADAARRFPLVLAAAFVAAYAAITMVNNSDWTPELTRALAAATLGFPLLFALTVLAERRARTNAARWALFGGGVVVLLAFWAAWPAWTDAIRALRYAQLSVAFHLLVAFLPYARSPEQRGFWQYNRALFLRFLTAGLYSAVLFVGLAIALLAVNKLLGVDVADEGYARLWIMIAFVFNTWFFVGGVPRDLAALDSYDEYPTGLRVFTQYVLVPIVAIYLLILTLYLGKVLVTRVWPSGWIGYLVSSVATVGILSWLLVHPLEERPEYAWVKTFTRGFYLAIMPAIIMLWLAIWKRVEQYGITERRYFLIVLSIWLGAIAVYYTLARSRSIKVIPASLAAVALLTFAGPWGAYQVSRASQLGRLRGLLARNALLANNALQPATHDVSFADRKEISSGLRYLLETHGAGTIAPWIGDSLKNAFRVGGADAAGEPRARAIMTALHLEYVTPWEGERDEYFSYYATGVGDPIAIAGFTQAMRIKFQAVRDTFRISGATYVRLGPDTLALRVERNGALLVELPLRALLERAEVYHRRNPSYSFPPGLLQAEAANGDVKVVVAFTELSGTRRQGVLRLTGFDGELFVRLP